jgi:hypothetical protein
MELIQFIEEKLNFYAEAVIKGHAKIDEHALGEMNFYMTLRRILNKSYSYQDIGMMDAINDTLQELGIIEQSEIFYKK